MSQPVAIFVSVNDRYFSGACVAIQSFLNSNEWFNGDIVVLSDKLSEEHLSLLSTLFKNLVVVTPDELLTKKVKVLSDQFKRLGQRAKIFYNLHVFTLNQYQRILKIDADMLFRKSLRPLFESDAVFAACPAWPMYLNQSRSRTDYALVEKDHSDALTFWVNAGLYSVSGSELTQTNYQSLLDYVTPDFWSSQVTNHTDQLCINAHFQDKITLLTPSYNFLLSHENIIRRERGITMEDAAVWHYAGPQKPWELDLKYSLKTNHRTFIKAQQEWQQVYNKLQRNIVQQLHLKQAHAAMVQRRHAVDH